MSRIGVACWPEMSPMVRMLKGAFSWVVVQRLGGGHLHRLLLHHDLGLGRRRTTSREAGDDRDDRARAGASCASSAATCPTGDQPEADADSMTPETRNADEMTCANVATVVFWWSTAPKSVSSARLVTGLMT